MRKIRIPPAALEAAAAKIYAADGHDAPFAYASGMTRRVYLGHAQDVARALLKAWPDAELVPGDEDVRPFLTLPEAPAP